jgi:SAM-dependent methyltransferase
LGKGAGCSSEPAWTEEQAKRKAKSINTSALQYERYDARADSQVQKLLSSFVAERCPLCQCATGTPAFSEGSYQTRRCSDCGLIFVFPRPAPTTISTIYEHDAAHTASRQLLAKSRSPLALAHVQHSLGIIQKYQPAGALLELGPGGGLFLAEAQKAGFSCLGLEPNPVQAAFIQQEFGIPCHTGVLTSETSFDSNFSVVYHCNVLSHLYAPLSTFQQLRHLLSPSGVLVFETGNFADVAPEYWPLIQQTERFQLPDHLCFFGLRSLQILLQKSGFALKNLYTYSRIPEKTAPHFFKKHPQLQHFLKYQLGAIVPRSGHPQTLIVVASSTSD